MFRLWIATVTLVMALGVAPALAGKGGNTASTSSIVIATVDGTAMAAATQSPSTRLGDALTFRTTVEQLAGWEYPMVALSCYQDVNGDGKVDTNLLGPDIVFSWLDRPGATFTRRLLVDLDAPRRRRRGVSRRAGRVRLERRQRVDADARLDRRLGRPGLGPAGFLPNTPA